MTMTLSGSGTIGGLVAGGLPDATITSAELAAGAPSRSQLPAGTVLQVVSTTKVDQFSTSSTSVQDVTGLSASITPTSASSKIFILVSTNMSCAGNAFLWLLRDSTNIYVGTGGGATNASAIFFPINVNAEQYTSMSYLDSPASTSLITYKIQVSQENANTLGINRRQSDGAFSYPSTITLMEIAA